MEHTYDLHNLNNDTWNRDMNLIQVINTIALRAHLHGSKHPGWNADESVYFWDRDFEIFEVSRVRVKVVNNAVVGSRGGQ